MSKSTPRHQNNDSDNDDPALEYGADWAENTRLFVKQDGGALRRVCMATLLKLRPSIC
jgi:hypothetical protein